MFVNASMPSGEWGHSGLWQPYIGLKDGTRESEPLQKLNTLQGILNAI